MQDQDQQHTDPWQQPPSTLPQIPYAPYPSYPSEPFLQQPPPSIPLHTAPPTPRKKLWWILGIVGGIALLSVCACCGTLALAGNLGRQTDTTNAASTSTAAVAQSGTHISASTGVATGTSTLPATAIPTAAASATPTTLVQPMPTIARAPTPTTKPVAIVTGPTLGGTREAFTAKYGEPAAPDLWDVHGVTFSLNMDTGVDSEDHAFEMLVYRSNASTWTLAEARLACAAFLPTDAVFLHHATTSSGYTEDVYRSHRLAATFPSSSVLGYDPTGVLAIDFEVANGGIFQCAINNSV